MHMATRSSMHQTLIRPDILDYQLPAVGATVAGATAASAPSTIKASRSRALRC